MGGILQTLNLSEILQVYSVNRLYLSVAVTGDKYSIFYRVNCMWTFSCVDIGEPRNFEFAAENCGPFLLSSSMQIFVYTNTALIVIAFYVLT